MPNLILPVFISAYLMVHPSNYAPTYSSIYPFICLPIYSKQDNHSQDTGQKPVTVGETLYDQYLEAITNYSMDYLIITAFACKSPYSDSMSRDWNVLGFMELISSAFMVGIMIFHTEILVVLWGTLSSACQSL